jgi:hypothetical protein
MNIKQTEIERRKSLAIDAIHAAYDPDDEDAPVTSYIQHHIEELDESYWMRHLTVAVPSPSQFLDLLVLRGHWGIDGNDEIDDAGIETFDFTLTGDVTDYVLSVSFNEQGEVTEIEMES